MRALVAFVVVAAGCSVEMGAGDIAPVAIDEPIDATQASPPVSFDMELEFLSADQSTALADQYGNKLGAVEAIDVDVQTLAITDVNGATVSGGVVIAAFQGVTIDHVGRTRLPDAVKQLVVQAVAQRMALTLPMRVTLGWPAGAPALMGAHALFQPIIVVDGLKAL